MESVAAKKKKTVSTTFISDDIAFSILSKLPFKSIKRFECVHKPWPLLSENPHFMNMFYKNLLSISHRCPHYDGASMLIKDLELGKEVFCSINGEMVENKVKLDFSNPFANRFSFRIFGFGSINGTLCLHHDHFYGKILLWNPSTHAIKLIPPTLDELVESGIPNVEHFLTIHDTFYLHGFGYNHLRNDYNVICYVSIRGEHADYGVMTLDPFWEIYSLRTNSWRILDAFDMPYSLACNDGTQVSMDGVCHWLCEEDEDSQGGPCLVSFYLSNEKLFITPMPSYSDDCFDVQAFWINLVVLNETIALISYHKETTNFHILGEYSIKESWTKLFMVGPLSCIERPIGVGTKGEIFVIRQDKELVCLDLSTQMIVELAYKEVNSIDRIVMYKENTSNWRNK